MHSLALKNDSLMTISVLAPRGFTRPLSMSHMYCMSSDGTGESGAPGTLSNASASLLQCPMDTDVLTQVIRLLELTVVPTYFVASPRALYMPLAVPQLAGHAALSTTRIQKSGARWRRFLYSQPWICLLLLISQRTSAAHPATPILAGESACFFSCICCGRVFGFCRAMSSSPESIEVCYKVRS